MLIEEHLGSFHISLVKSWRIQNPVPSHLNLSPYIPNWANQIRYRLLQCLGMPFHGENLITGGRPCRVSIQPLLASLVKLLASALIKPLSNTCLAAQLGNAFLPPQAAQNNAYLDLGEVVPHGGSSDVFDHLLSRGLGWIGFHVHLHSLG